MKSENLQTKNVEKSLIFHVFWCFVRYEILTLGMKTSEKNMFPLIRKHFSSVLSNELRNVEKKSKSEKLQTKKVEKSLIFHVFWCFVRYEIFT